MLGNSNYVDITGQIEEVFDEKIQQIPIATTDYVEDRIQEITEAQGTFDPAILDDYSKTDHTHTTINNALTVNGGLKTTGDLTCFQSFLNQCNFKHSTRKKIFLYQSDSGSLQIVDENQSPTVYYNLYQPSGNFSVRNDLTVGNNLNVQTDKFKVDQSQTTVNNNLFVNSQLTLSGKADIGGVIESPVSGHKLGYLEISSPYLRYWREKLNTSDDKNMYFQIGRSNSVDSDCFWMNYTYPGKMLFKFYGGGGHNFLMMDKSTDLMTIYSSLTVNKNLTVNGSLNGYTIGTSDNSDNKGRIATIDKTHGILDIGRFLDFHYPEKYPEANDWCVRFQCDSGNQLALYGPNSSEGHYMSINFNTKANGTTIVKDNLQVDKDLSVNGDLYVKGVKIDGSGGGGTIPSELTVSKVNFGENWYIANYENSYLFINHYQPDTQTITSLLEFDNDNKSISTQWNLKTTGTLTVDGASTLKGSLHAKHLAVFYKEVEMQDGLVVDGDMVNYGTAALEHVSITGKLTVKGTEITGNQTILHKTDVISGEPGTFCETNGGIYTGYDKITETDCICQVQQSTTLNTKIVGIITSSDHFASHGDVLVKIVPGTYHLGDILCPDISGKARKATETELQFMTLHAIPRAKITSLDTKIEGTVACFIA